MKKHDKDIQKYPAVKQNARALQGNISQIKLQNQIKKITYNNVKILHAVKKAIL